MINWHRLFGIFLTDYFTDTPYVVELEKDLSLQQQFLDVVILRKEQGDYQGVFPDGLDNLKTHNLVSYKSMRESFDLWAMQELIGHYVNYRKQMSNPLLPESDFSLYAISTRFPTGLAQQTGLTELMAGVYELNVLSHVRLIVLSQIAQAEHNALWHLFSHNVDKIKFGVSSYHAKTPVSSIVNVLYENYESEGLIMSYTLEDFHKEVAREHLHYLSSSEILNKFSINERLDGLSLEDILANLKGLSKEDVLAYFEKNKENK